MSVNLVDLVMKQMGGSLPGILGSLLGESADRTKGAVAGAVPAILGGLVGAASKGGDVADQIAAAVGRQDDSILDNLGSAFGGGNHKSMIEQGSGVLSSLLGDGAIGALVGGLGKFSGLGGGSTKSLLGMLVPIVMSVLSREQKSQGLDSGGLRELLASQKDHIEAAMPKGLASALGGVGFMDDVLGTARSATESIGEAAESAAGKVGQAAGQAATAVGGAVESAGDSLQSAASSASDRVGQAASSASASVGQGVERAGQAAQNITGSASETASNASAAAAGAAQGGGSWLRWLLPLIILLALIWLAFKFLGGGPVDETASDAGDAADPAVEATTDAAGDAADTASDAETTAADTTSDATDAADDAATTAGDAVSDAADAASDVATTAANTASDAADAASEATGDAATAAVDAASDVTDAASDAAGDAADTASAAAGSALESVTAMVGDVDVGGELNSTFEGLTSTLSGITDVESAKEALPSLEEMSTSLDGLTDLSDQLPESAVGGISEMVSNGIDSLDGIVANLESIPGVGEVIKPVVDQIKEKLSSFTTA